MSEQVAGLVEQLCWNCEFPMFIGYQHLATGHVIKCCVKCSAPWDLGDEKGLEIMEKLHYPEGREYARQWREARASMSNGNSVPA